MNIKYAVVDKYINVLFKGSEDEALKYCEDTGGKYFVIPINIRLPESKENAIKFILDAFPKEIARLKPSKTYSKSNFGWQEKVEDKNRYDIEANGLLLNIYLQIKKNNLIVEHSINDSVYTNEINVINLFKEIAKRYHAKFTNVNIIPNLLEKIVRNTYESARVESYDDNELRIEIENDELLVHMEICNNDYTFKVEGCPYVYDSYAEGVETIKSIQFEISRWTEKLRRLTEYTQYFSTIKIPLDTLIRSSEVV